MKEKKVTVYYMFPKESKEKIMNSGKIKISKGLWAFGGKGIYVTLLNPKGIGNIQKTFYGLRGHAFPHFFGSEHLTDVADFYLKIELPASMIKRTWNNLFEWNMRKIPSEIKFNNPEIKVSNPIKINKKRISELQKRFKERYGVHFNPFRRLIDIKKTSRFLVNKIKRK
jgi:hypothetical protein